ncbi:crossover junction endodeoxyribonuclease RuvC [bacterium]|nr:crossover junction endodeoxyribonuclease RuvC [bacterium]
MIVSEPQTKQKEVIDKPAQIVLGFDPGTVATGWGVIERGRKHRLLGYGALRPKKDESLEQRLLFLFNGANELIQSYHPTVVAIEDPFVGKNARSALALGRAGGVLLVAAAQNNLEIANYTPRTIKSAIVGRGAATKEQVQFMVQRLLGLQEAPKPLDASDAIAVALCHLNRHRGF